MTEYKYEKTLGQELDKVKKATIDQVYFQKYQIDITNLSDIDYSKSYESVSTYIEKSFKIRIVFNEFRKKLKSSMLVSYSRLIRKVRR